MLKKCRFRGLLLIYLTSRIDVFYIVPSQIKWLLRMLTTDDIDPSKSSTAITPLSQTGNIVQYQDDQVIDTCVDY